MGYKRFVKAFFCVWVVLFVSYFIVAIIVDPLDILEMPKITGFNRIKTQIDGYAYIWKPYHSVKKRYRVMFIGTSRVENGIKSSLSGYQDKDVFNFANSDLQLHCMEKHLDMLYRRQFAPEKLFVGIDFFQFGKKDYWSNRVQFSEERLDILAKNEKISVFQQKIRDTLGCGISMVYKTIIDNVFGKEKSVLYERGYRRSVNKGFSEGSDRKILKQYKKRYQDFVYEEEASATLTRIIRKAKRNNVKVYLFVNPVHDRLRMVLHDSGHEEKWEEIKKNLKDVVGNVYELNGAEYTANNSYWAESSHYTAELGEILKHKILKDMESCNE